VAKAHVVRVHVSPATSQRAPPSAGSVRSTSGGGHHLNEAGLPPNSLVFNEREETEEEENEGGNF
jgi:hypothetical protein